MSTGNLKLDILLGKVKENIAFDSAPSDDTLNAIRKQFPSITEKEAQDIYAIIHDIQTTTKERASLVLTAPPSFSVRTQSTKNTVEKMLSEAMNSILITGYSLSEYFDDMIDMIIQKSQQGVLVKFYVNDIDSQPRFEKLCRYKGRYLKIFNYKKTKDPMSALHAKVISTDKTYTLITSANLSYHGQLGNIELGTLIESPVLAKQVEDVFTQLLFSKTFIEV